MENASAYSSPVLSDFARAVGCSTALLCSEDRVRFIRSFFSARLSLFLHAHVRVLCKVCTYVKYRPICPRTHARDGQCGLVSFGRATGVSRQPSCDSKLHESKQSTCTEMQVNKCGYDKQSVL